MHINTIVVANEEKIKQSANTKEITYDEIKEKIIQRTIRYIPNYSNIVASVIDGIIIPDGKDEEGFNKYEVKTHTKEVESDFAKGIVLSIPIGTDSTIKVGDTIVYPKKFAKDFDLFKDSQLVKPYDVVAKVVK